jgi:hypothetical protein
MSDFKRESHWLPYGFALFFAFGIMRAAAALGDMQIGQGEFHFNGEAKLIETSYARSRLGRYTFAWVTPPQLEGKQFVITGSTCHNFSSVLNWFYLWPKLSEPVEIYRTDKNQLIVRPCYDFSLWTLIVNPIAVAGLIFFGRRLVASLSPEERARAMEYRK